MSQTLAASRPESIIARLAPHLRWLAPLLLVLVTAIAYAPAINGTFVLDDRPHIVETIGRRTLWPLTQYLGRRGVADFTLVLNHAIDGLNPRGYHLFNVIIHLLAGLTLYGVVRRVLLQPQWKDRFAGCASWLALIIALLWMVHPLNTQAVTYVIQRAESMAGLFVLLGAYALVRMHDDRRWWWGLISLAFVWLAITSKESALPVPVALLLLDRCLLTQRWIETLKRRGWVFLIMLPMMLMPLLAGVGEFQQAVVPTTDDVIQAAVSQGRAPDHVIPAMMELGRYPSAGFGMAGLTWKQYFFSQPMVILFYLKQTFWPDWLSLEHNWRVMRTPWAGFRALDFQIALGVLLALAVGSLWSLWRLPWLGFLGCWFFFFLGISSSFIPINDIAVEHRMYLAMIPVIVLVVLAGWLLVSRWQQRVAPSPLPAAGAWGAVMVCVAVTLALGTRTFVRNTDYASELTIWHKAAAGQKPNARIYVNLGSAYYRANQVDKARECYELALLDRPGDPNALLNLGSLAYNRQDWEQAKRYYRQCLRIASKHTLARISLSRIAIIEEDLDRAYGLLKRAIELEPDSSPALRDMGKLQFRMGRFEEALETYQTLVRLDGESPEQLVNIAMVQVRMNRLDDAVAGLTHVTQKWPAFGPAWEQLAQTLARQGRYREGEAALRQAIQVAPNMRLSQQLAILLSSCPDESIRNLPEALAIVDYWLKITGRRDPSWLEVASRVAQGAGRYDIALEAELEALAIAKERGASQAVIDQALADIRRIQQKMEAATRPATPAPVPIQE
jgi:tetratricopeptide (TPR) repeat protein